MINIKYIVADIDATTCAMYSPRPLLDYISWLVV